MWYNIKKLIIHDILGRHVPGTEIKTHGIQRISYCKYCGKQIIQNPRGKWF